MDYVQDHNGMLEQLLWDFTGAIIGCGRDCSVRDFHLLF